MPPVKNPCIDCKKATTSKSISCCVCQRWVHADCVGLETYNLVSHMKEREGYHVWSCSGCTAAYKQLSDACATNTKTIQVLTETVTKLAESVNSQKESIAATNLRVDNLDEKIDKVKADKENMKKETESSVFRELNEIKARKKNLVFHGIPEAEASLAAKDKKDQDMTELVEVLSKIDVTIDVDSDVKACIRIGQKNNEEPDKTRPLLIVFDKEDIRDSILKNARKLADTAYNDISIVPDLTKKQRIEESKLRKEADEKNQNMDEETAKNWIYRCIGPRGEQRVERIRKKPENQSRGPNKGSALARRH